MNIHIKNNLWRTIFITMKFGFEIGCFLPRSLGEMYYEDNSDKEFKDGDFFN
jgi:hypothetical protein